MSGDGSGRFAVVTGASTGIGLELAGILAREGFEVLVVADEPAIETVAERLRMGAPVDALQADLATRSGIDSLWDRIGARQIDVLCANAGIGLGHAFLDQDWDDIARVIDTNVTGTTDLVHRALRLMRMRGRGRVLITGSIAGYIPGSYQAVYNGTKAYLDTLSRALPNELNDSEVTVTCLMPGPTDTQFFTRAGMEGTPVGRDDGKADPATVAQAGYDAMMKGAPDVTPGLKNTLQTTLAGVLPDKVLASMHRRMAKPTSEGEPE